MAFDSEFFAQALMRASNRFGDSMDRRREREREEKFTRERMETEHRYSLTERAMSEYSADKRQRAAEAHAVKLAKLGKDLSVQEAAEKANLSAQYDTFLNDPSFASNIMEDYAKGPQGIMSATLKMQAVQKMREGQPLSMDEMQTVGTLGPIAMGRLREINRESSRENMAMKDAQARIDYTRWLMDSKPEQMTPAAMAGIQAKMRDDITALAAVGASDEYARAAGAAARCGIDPSTGEGTPEQWEKFQRDNASAAVQFRGLLTKRDLMSLSIEESRKTLERFTSPQRPVSESVPEPSAPSKGEAPGAVIPKDADSVKPKAKFGAGIVSAAKNLEASASRPFDKLREAADAAEFRRKYNLPEGKLKIHYMSESDSYEDLANSLRSGELLYTPEGDLYRIRIGANGVPLLAPVEKRDKKAEKKNFVGPQRPGLWSR